MNVLQRARRAFSRKRMKATRYDAAKVSRHTERWWAAAADNLSANQSNTRAVRERIRQRSRSEVANNSVAQGIVATLVNDVVGTGPRLQLVSDRADRETLRLLEHGWSKWDREIGLTDKLSVGYRARVVDGEFVGVIDRDARGRTLRIVECDRLTSGVNTSDDVDGVILDSRGEPVRYLIRRHHPGGPSPSSEVDPYPAGQVIHFFRQDRPEQARGLPYLTPALPLFAQLRAYTLATLTSAEAAAAFSGVIQSDASPFDDELEVPEAGDLFDLERGAFVTLPMGWKLAQLKAEHPTTEYGAFRRAIINEIARCLNMPYNVAAGDSSGYNYASGRLDHQIYFRSLKIEQQAIERKVLDRMLRVYLDDAAARSGVLPASVRTMLLSDDVRLSWQWHWPGREHVDPAKEATAAATRLSSGVTNYKLEYARQGLDWEEELEQRAREIELLRERGIAPASLDMQMEVVDDDEDEEV